MEEEIEKIFYKILNRDIAELISKEYYNNLKKDRINIMNTLHYELLKNIHLITCNKINNIDYDLVYLQYTMNDTLSQNELVEQHDYYHNILLDIELQLFLNYKQLN